ncbi:hypothetical protein SAMN05444673_3569 [Bacillus sp. OV166]|uniref:hypothetical protein n=1 Tax=Bacillus sp. OV166 TaxID=1882763 RepID=UPI000A2AB71E|nr:hypothetical protein [Bacillus sp. OV166]SMQ78676.1 hypothetical protein SAMN05444673_3569 [Bacillus sp. OV166]
MKKEMLLVIASFFLMSLTAITGVYAIEETTKTVTITKEQADITGDEKEEQILLKGVPYQKEDTFLEKIYIEIAASNGKTFSFPLESGAKASLLLVDLNHDGVKDVFASVLTGENKRIVHNYSYSMKDFVHTNLALPEPIEMDSHFLNGFKAEIKLAKTGKSYRFDLKDRQKYYKKLGLYYKGKLNEPTELTVNPYSSLQPIQLEGNKVGLLGEQKVTGIANADLIALVKSTWSFEKGHWKLIGTVVNKEINN